MSGYNKFNFKSYEEISSKICELDVNIKLQQDLSPLHRTVKIGAKTAPNSIAILPMEGCDSNLDGSPSELVARRYMRFAGGGAGLLWWEANAVAFEGRANEHQMMLTIDNIGKFSDLLKQTNMEASDRNGADHRPVNVLQLTHSGRYSRPVGHMGAPLVPQRDPLLDLRSGVVSSDSVITDAYLDELIGKYVQSAVLAQKAGFDGVDIKACHRYLVSELLASFTREGKYGGSFENRTRFLLDVIKAVRKATGPDFIIACRFNVFDAHPYPYGFGCDHDDMWKFDPTEPMHLVRLMVGNGVNLLSNSAGNPYYIYPQVTRPFDTSSMGIPTPDEHPLKSIARLFDFTRQIQKVAADVPVVGNGYTWLRQFMPFAGAANINDHSCMMMGMGRSAFAYPDSARDMLTKGSLDSKKCCTTCSKCTQIMRDHGMTGCVIRDSEIYAPLYKKFREEAAARENGRGVVNG